MTSNGGSDVTSAFADVLDANHAYADQHGEVALLPQRAARSLAVLMCIDARTEPLSPLGLALGDAIVFRNLGGQVTDEALTAFILAVHRSGVKRILILQHTDCGMTKLTADGAHALITEATGVDASSLEIRPITDQRARVAEDVDRIRSSPFIPDDIPVLGAIFDLETGRIIPV